MSEELAQKIIEVGRWMFDRRLTDIAGGNISARSGDQMYITPTGAGQKYLWDLRPSEIICTRWDCDELMSRPDHSKESISHLFAYRAFPEIGAVIHAHPFHLRPFCALSQAPKPVMLADQLYGEMAVIPEAPLYSAEQGELIVAALSPKRELIARMAAAVLMPRHGIFVAGRNLNTALDCLERMDNSAWTELSVRALEKPCS